MKKEIKDSLLFVLVYGAVIFVTASVLYFLIKTLLFLVV